LNRGQQQVSRHAFAIGWVFLLFWFAEHRKVGPHREGQAYTYQT